MCGPPRTVHTHDQDIALITLAAAATISAAAADRVDPHLRPAGSHSEAELTNVSSGRMASGGGRPRQAGAPGQAEDHGRPGVARDRREESPLDREPHPPQIEL